MLLLLLCLLLSCWAPSCPSPVPLEKGCPNFSLLDEAIEDIRRLQAKNETVPPSNITSMMEQGEKNAVIYLDEFIKALESNREKSKEKRVIQKLRVIYAAGETCTEWLKYEWEPMKTNGFFKNLNELLKFLKTYNYSEETT